MLRSKLVASLASSIASELKAGGGNMFVMFVCVKAHLVHRGRRL